MLIVHFTLTEMLSPPNVFQLKTHNSIPSEYPNDNIEIKER